MNPTREEALFGRCGGACPFFIGTLFQPERSALRGEVHPLMCAFLRGSLFAQK